MEHVPGAYILNDAIADNSAFQRCLGRGPILVKELGSQNSIRKNCRAHKKDTSTRLSALWEYWISICKVESTLLGINGKSFHGRKQYDWANLGAARLPILRSSPGT